MAPRPSLPQRRTAQGDPILFTLLCEKTHPYISAHQIRSYWADIPLEDQTLSVFIEDGRTHDLEIKYSLQVQNESVSHRFMIRSTGFAELLQALGAKAADILGISRDGAGQLRAELNTEEVRAAHALLPQTAPRQRRASAAGAGGSSSSPAPPPSPGPASPPAPAPRVRRPPGGVAATASKRRAAPNRAGMVQFRIGQSKPKWIQAAGGAKRRRGDPDGPAVTTLYRPPLAPMVLLPGEEPLGVEAAADHLPPPPQRYLAAVERARGGMAARARAIGGDALADRALAASRRYEAEILRGEAPGAAAMRRDAAIEYDAVLREVYGAQILDPHVLRAAALAAAEGSADLQLLRVMERRFIVWETAETEDGGGEGAEGMEVDGEAPAAAAAAPRQSWLAGMGRVWRTVLGRLGARNYEEVGLGATMDGVEVSCALNDTLWHRGAVVRQGLRPGAPVRGVLEAAAAGRREAGRRLYLTDGSAPDYVGRGYPRGAPGMPCRVDATANAAFPHAVRSNRATNAFHFLKNESTGTGTFTAFAALGPGANLTAFHYETKRRRSYNCASGDHIVQPLATAENARRLMRVHAAVAGRHSRHGQYLPLEVYLEEGVVLVTHLRLNDDAPSLVELCEQSMHAFATFSDAAAAAGKAGKAGAPLAPPMKVSCNDFDLVWEMDAAYALETLVAAYGRLPGGLLAEEAPPPDGADTWVQSSYLQAEPRTRAGRENASAVALRPWACEAARAAAAAGPPEWAAAAAEAHGEVEDGELDPGMDVVAVRSTEKLLDVAAGLLAPATVGAWVGEVPSAGEAAAALARLVPVLHHMLSRAWSEEDAAAAAEESSDGSEKSEEEEARGSGGAAAAAPADPRFDCHFSREYLEDLLERVAASGAVDVAAALAASAPALPPGVLADCEDAGLLGTALSPAALRALWLRRLAEERDAAVARPLDPGALAAARRRRSAAEAAFDVACAGILKRHADWVAEEAEAEEVNVTD